MKLPLVPFALFSACVMASPDPAKVDAVFADYDSTNTPGCSLGVYQNGEIAYAKGYGMANLEHGIANGPETIFRIASTSKQFAAMAIVLLAEQGKLSLDDDIHKFFPDMPDYGEPITVRQLLHHTSGIRDYLELAWMADWGNHYQVAEAVELIIRQQGLNFPPNSEYLYSNSGYLLLAQIVEIVSGESLREWAEANMFEPLGMTSTHFHDDHTHIVPNRASGYADWDGEGLGISMTQLDMVGDGGIFTNVTEMLKWEQNFYANQLGKGDPALIELLETPGVLDDGEVLDYALGLGIGEFQGVREVSHGGSWMGYRAEFIRYPSKRLGISVFCNDGMANPEALAREVAAVYLGQTGDQAAGDPAPGSDAPGDTIVEVAESELENFTGDYWKAEDGILRTVALDEGSLWYGRGGDNRTRLDPLGEGRFLMADVGVRVLVSFTASGDMHMNVAVDGQEPWHLERFKRAQPSAQDLQALSGSWYSPELDHTQVLAVTDGVLTALRREQDQALEPLQHDRFASGEGLVITFQRNGSGKVSGMSVNSGRVQDLEYQRR